MSNRTPEIVGPAYGFGDILIEPRVVKGIRSRRGPEISTQTVIAKGLPPIEYPIISANMDTVTEWEMAEAMALYGGIGIIHRFMTPEAQAEEIRKVKERVRFIEEFPPTLPPEATIRDAKDFLRRRKRGYVIVRNVSDEAGHFLGIATTRDFLAGSLDASLKEVMIPRDRVLTVPAGTTFEQAVEFMKQHRIQKVPVVYEDGTLKGVYTLKDDWFYQYYPNASLDKKGRLMVGGAVGVKELDIRRAHLLEEAGADLLIVDIAHGGLEYTSEMLDTLKVRENIRTPIGAGNTATGEGIIYVRDSGADMGKVGVSPGWTCETRKMTKVGVPQITAIMESREAAGDDFPIVADGGIREPGDAAAALAAGADAVMVGTLFAGTDKSPGEIIPRPDGKYEKVVRGMASASAYRDRAGLGDIDPLDIEDIYEEGRTEYVPYKGPESTRKVLKWMVKGIRSEMSYIGAHTIKEMPSRTRIRIVAGESEPKRSLG